MRHHPSPLSPGSLALCLAVVLLTVSCFEGPVRERLWIEILPDSRARITARAEVDRTTGADSQVVRERAEVMRASLQAGTDFWSRQFARLDAIEDQTTLERNRGTLTAVEWTAIVELEGLEAVFDGSSISMFVTEETGWSELAIYTGKSDRASREQREMLTGYLRTWSSELEHYFAALDRLVRHIELAPSRRELLWAAVFEELDEEAWEELLTTRERALVEELFHAIERTWEVFSLGDDQALSLQQLGYLVYDPFPSDLEIELPGEILEVEGFGRADNSLTIERVGLWEAFDSLRESIVENDPLSFWMEEETRDDEGSLTDRFLETEVRIASTPTAAEIIESLETHLRPERTYRVRWRP